MEKLAGRGGPGEAGETRSEVRTILVICPTHRDVRELPLVSEPGTIFLYHEYGSESLENLIGGNACDGALAADPIEEIDRILAKVEGVALGGVISSDDYPGAALAAVVAKALGLPGPEPEIVLFCQHKYLSRVAQVRHVPDAVPCFALVDAAAGAALPADLTFPCFVKPVKSFFSIGAQMVESAPELAALKPRWTRFDQFFLPLERMLERYAGKSIGTGRLIAEAPLKGEQVTVEGYAYEGEVSVIGVVDSIMFPGTLAFSRFEYPSSQPESVQARMADIAATLMQGLGFDNGLFNIEMMYDSETDCIAIIEINPRMASQFADLYEKVDGTSSYSVLLAIAEGRKPEFLRRRGRYAFAASCVLRTFEDLLVAGLPTEAALERLARLYPDCRLEVHATLGRRLSHELQDGHSYRYGIVSLGGRDRAEVLEAFEACREGLGIVLLPPPPLAAQASLAGAEANLIVADGLGDPVREGCDPGKDVGIA